MMRMTLSTPQPGFAAAVEVVYVAVVVDDDDVVDVAVAVVALCWR